MARRRSRGRYLASRANDAHVSCLATLNGFCVSVDVDTLSGSFFSQSGELRTTGAVARLTVTVGKGSIAP